MGSHRPRQGSLGWYHNSKRGKSIPSLASRNPVFFIKQGMETMFHDQEYMGVTNLLLIPTSRINQHQVTLRIKGIGLGQPRNDVIRNTRGEVQDLKGAHRLIITGFNKPRGTLGPTARRGLKLQSRKNLRTGTRRNPGPMGCRHPATVSWRKPFAGLTGGNQRTVRGIKLIHWDPEGSILKIRGCVPGKRGSVLAVRVHD